MSKREQIVELIEKFKNDKGGLDCGIAFKLASKLDIDVSVVGKTADEIGVKIDACELGQFGKLEFGDSSILVYKNLQNKLDEKRRIFCSDARDAAKGVGLKKIRSTLKDYN
ncbi:MAG: hypothetical protein LUC34_06125, partial [Campylobacter sp.]|nr:hypothetical protein [Campylobacter sp.]